MALPAGAAAYRTGGYRSTRQDLFLTRRDRSAYPRSGECPARPRIALIGFATEPGTAGGALVRPAVPATPTLGAGKYGLPTAEPRQRRARPVVIAGRCRSPADQHPSGARPVNVPCCTSRRARLRLGVDTGFGGGSGNFLSRMRCTRGARSCGRHEAGACMRRGRTAGRHCHRAQGPGLTNAITGTEAAKPHADARSRR